MVALYGVTSIYGRLQHLEERTKTLFKDVGEIKTSLDFVNSDVEVLKQKLEIKQTRVAWQN